MNSDLSTERGGDEENKRRSKKERKVAEAVSAASEEFDVGETKAAKDQIDQWLGDLATDAEYNISSYVDCFLAENLVRKYLADTQTPLSTVAQKEARKWKDQEQLKRQEANLNFEIRKDVSDLSYLGMDELSISAEGQKMKDGKPTPLFADAVNYRPVRNVIGHTGLLTANAKTYLSLRLENIKGRLKVMLRAIH